MRAALFLVVVLGGCLAPDYSSGYPDGTYQPGNPQPSDQGGCRKDTDCSSNLVCARDYSCIAKSQVYTAHVNWTIHGAAASAATCAGLPDLDLQFFTSDNYYFGYSPIACSQGKFTIDKLPMWYVQASIGPQNEQGTFARIDATTGNATLDLPY